MSERSIDGFSRFTKSQKLRWLVKHFFNEDDKVIEEMESYGFVDHELQETLDRFSENTVSNFHLPYGVAPNFKINGRAYCIPMVIEESSVVAAAANAAKFWSPRGGFKAEVISVIKEGQVHFTWPGDLNLLKDHFDELKLRMLSEGADLTRNMEARGGGIADIELLDLSSVESHLYQIKVGFDTADSMGANFINSVLESFAGTLQRFILDHPPLRHNGAAELDIVMSILSNYSPRCLVKAWVECPVSDLEDYQSFDKMDLALRFEKAIRLAQIDCYRAVTHNKGIFNGIDAVAIATGNDFRAIEANAHAYAARDGKYRGLTHCKVEDGSFLFEIIIPLTVGTVGGLTTLHPLAGRSLELLGHPNSRELMMIMAVMGLAQNFAAVRSLITTGIQKGHMKMHLHNMLTQLDATPSERSEVEDHFLDKTVSYADVREYLSVLRNNGIHTASRRSH